MSVMRAARFARRIAVVLGVGAGLSAAGPVLADEAAPARSWADEITVNGFVSGSYSYNFRRPPTHQNAYRVFDFDDNTFKLDVVELVVQHAVAKPRDAGFRVDLAMGGSVPRVAASAGLFRDAVTGAGQDIDVHQAFASYVAPLGAGLRIDAGKFVTPCGTEVIEGYDGWNDEATRSLLFGWAIPFTHTGVRAAYTVSPNVAVTGMLVNGWDLATDNNSGKTGGVQLTLTGPRGMLLAVTGMAGPEQADDAGHPRRLLDVVASVKASSRVTLGANGDWGAEDHLFAEPTPSGEARIPTEWSGVAGYARWQITDALALAARGETFRDRDGARTGTPQTLNEWTLTPELRMSPRFLVRGDFRIDESSTRVFPTATGVTDSQTTMLVNVIATF